MGCMGLSCVMNRIGADALSQSSYIGLLRFSIDHLQIQIHVLSKVDNASHISRNFLGIFM